jgi:hypothetical protein
MSQAASAAEPSQQELMDQLKSLQAKIERLEANQNQQQQAGNAKSQDATLDSVLKDAERRSQLMQAEGFTAGYSKGKFLIQDASGNFVMNPNFQFQIRHVTNFRDEDAADGGDEAIESGLEIRRMKIAFDGNVFTPDLVYKFQWASNRAGGALALEDAWIRYTFDKQRGLAFRAGQFKDPTLHEEIVSSKRQLAVDRSLLNEVLGGGQTDYIQGASIIWDDGAEGLPLRAEVGYSDGINSDNTNFQDGGGSALLIGPLAASGTGATAVSAVNPDWGAFARAEYLAFGNWKQYDDFTVMGNTEDLLVLGAGVSYTEAGEADLFIYTADAQYETGRLGLYGAYVGTYGEPEGRNVTSGGVNNWGFLVQAGYMLDQDGKWEVFGRYNLTNIDDNALAAGAEDSFSEITAGVNYYFKGHAAKFTLDVNWLPNGVPSNETGIGYIDPDGDEQQFAVRGQFQLLL